ARDSARGERRLCETALERSNCGLAELGIDLEDDVLEPEWLDGRMTRARGVDRGAERCDVEREHVAEDRRAKPFDEDERLDHVLAREVPQAPPDRLTLVVAAERGERCAVVGRTAPMGLKQPVAVRSP